MNAVSVSDLLEHSGDCVLMVDLESLWPLGSTPEDAVHAPEVRELLNRASALFPSVAVLAGRGASVARRILGTDKVALSGLYGAEFLAPGVDPGMGWLSKLLVPWERRVQTFTGALRDLVGSVTHELVLPGGIWVEDRGCMLALYPPNEDVEHDVRGVVEMFAREAGFDTRSAPGGILEIMPPVAPTKREAVLMVVRRSEAQWAIYLGGDENALHGVDYLVNGEALLGAAKIVVASAGMPSELAEAADLVVPGLDGMIAWLHEVVSNLEAQSSAS
jgi:hypothetical protein